MNISKYTKPFSLQLKPIETEPASQEEREQLATMRESVTYWKDALRRFLHNKVALFCFAVIVFIVLFAYVGPMLSPYTFDQQIRGDERMGPCILHPFGTDSLGRDMLVRTMVATQLSLMIGFFSAIIVLAIGTIYGATSGFWGGKVDNIMMRIAEIFYSLPDILIIIILQIALKRPLAALFPHSKLGPSVMSIYIAFALLYWVSMARMVRGQVLQVKQNEYVTAAVAMGASKPSIISRHLIPNCIGVIIVQTLFQIPAAIFTEAFLGFVGLGPSAPLASLGSLASDALNGFQSNPHLLFFPSAMICILILAFNQFGDGLRDALDPRLRK